MRPKPTATARPRSPPSPGDEQRAWKADQIENVTKKATVDPEKSSGSYYKNCAAARAAGAAPLHRGEAGYRKGLDRDGDGIACE